MMNQTGINEQIWNFHHIHDSIVTYETFIVVGIAKWVEVALPLKKNKEIFG